MLDPSVGPRSRGAHERQRKYEHKHYIIIWILKVIAVFLVLVLEIVIIGAVFAFFANWIIKSIIP